MWTNAYSYEDIGEFLREARRARDGQERVGDQG